MFLLLLAALAPAADPPKNPLVEELTRQGLAVPGGARVKLPEPVLPDGLSALKQQAIVDTLADKFPPGVFVRKTATAPYLLTINPIGQKRRGHTLDLIFIAYGKLSQLEKENSLNQLLGMERKDGKKGSAHALTEVELADRKIKLQKSDNQEDGYAVLDTILVDKVQLSGVVHGVKTAGPKSLLAASRLDVRFADDKKHPNRWRSVKIAPDGTEILGPPQPYTGFGGYLKVTELTRPAGALLIEVHFAFAEPHGWFQGYNVLASKLPLAVRENVQAFRRKLGKGR